MLVKANYIFGPSEHAEHEVELPPTWASDADLLFAALAKLSETERRLLMRIEMPGTLYRFDGVQQPAGLPDAYELD